MERRVCQLNYDDKLCENIRSEILSEIESLNTSEGSFVSEIVTPISLEFENTYREFAKICDLSFLDKITGEYLELRASEYGIERKNGTYATGEVTFYGVDDTVVSKGTIVTTIGGLLYYTTEETVINSGEGKASIIAENIGISSNVSKGNITSMGVSVIGVSSVINENETTGGTNIETDDELLLRLLFVLQTPETSGNVYHYQKWALECAGVANVKVFPLYYGNGTVMVMPVSSNGRAPNEDILANVYNYIEENRPIGASVTVLAPTEVFINIKVKLTTNADKEIVAEKYKEIVNNYIVASVFSATIIDTNRLLAYLYNVEEVITVEEILVNDFDENIILNETEIAVLGEVEIL